MAKDTEDVKGKIFSTVAGIDESIELVSDEPGLAGVNGSFPFFYGMHQRLYGKKLIDFNPGQSVYGVHQTFNGVCLYGYYVQTNEKLYYHLCNAPPDLRIRFWTP